ncbi:hypothetical protein GCM10023213_10930 [Prosthecobacter algae]|uniref:Uncharacterized protein n=1 Tax=Prosthecobacter algae TaxID=1144682 RepID=A0ABP9P3K0_9BACT
MKTIVDSTRDPITGIVNIRLRPQYSDTFAAFLTSTNIRFSRSDAIFPYRGQSGQQEDVVPFLIYDFDDEIKNTISAWDDSQ